MNDNHILEPNEIEPTQTPQEGGKTDARKDTDSKPKRRNPMSYVHRVLLRALVVVIILYILFAGVIGVMHAPNDDMTPRIDGRDLILYYRLDKEIHTDDVVVLRKNDTTYLGRVIASGGDTVEITDDENVVVNGNTLTEARIYYRTPRYEGFVEYPLTLAGDEYFILVDYRSGGEDSRYYGPVSRDEILGTVITILRRNNL